MHHILSFDSSNNRCSVAISRGNNILSFNEDVRPHMQAENLVPLIELTLKDAGLDYGDMEYLAVTRGPGSFTGIRIGLAVAQGILHATNIKPIGISNFEYGYYRLKQQVQVFDRAYICIDAFRGQQYVQEFDNSGPLGDAILIDNEDIKNIINSEGKTICAGSGMANICQYIKQQEMMILPRFAIIKAHQIARLANEKIFKGEISNDIEPLYIRAPDAIKQN